MKRNKKQHISRLVQRSLFFFYCAFGAFTALAQIEYTNESVLSSGNFYKFSVQETGICKINKAFLEEMGLNIENALLSELRIYGNGGGMLPEQAGDERADDLLENSIEVVDQNGNNLMDNEDYVLFYAESPDVWEYQNEISGVAYLFNQHFYSNKNHYFLTFDKGTGKRIEKTASNANFDFETNQYDALRYYEEANENPLQSGREWFGSTLVPGQSENVDFVFPKIVAGSEIEIEAVCVGAYGENSSQFNISVNNQLATSLYYTATPSGSLQDSEVAPYGIIKMAEFSIPANENINLSFEYAANSSAPRGNIDYAVLRAKCALDFSGNTLENGILTFSNFETLGKGIIKYNLTNVANNLRIWEIEANGIVSEKDISNNFFTGNNANSLQKFIAFDESAFVTPSFEKQISNQNLHALNFPEFVIVAHANFMDAANELADFHRTADNMEVLVVELEQVYNEFSSGNADISAIRNLMKMFYDRAKNTDSAGKLPENLLLLGDASYDYKNIANLESENANFVPTYESPESLNRRTTYCSDDYFAFLDDNEGDNILSGNSTVKMDIGVGRFPVKTAQEANDMVNKVKHYKTNISKGAWLNNLTFISDDGNGNLHFDQAELHASDLTASVPSYNIDKIHCDAYPQVSTSGGSTYPGVNTAINNKIFTGSFIMNYSGHGGEGGWADEQILTSDIIRSWQNIDKLPLFITATCSFTRYDRPKDVTAGEWLVLNPDGGAIALMTTVRLVYASQNRALNEAFLDAAFDFSDGVLSIGEIARRAKNSLSNSENSRKFVLMGNPALKLNYPSFEVETTEISRQVSETETVAGIDTLRAMEQITISGAITDTAGVLISDFNGTISPVIYDKFETLTTLGNDPPLNWDGEGNCPGTSEKETSCPWDFDLQRSIIFKGNASVENGRFTFSFIVPKDIAYNFGKGKISYFALAEDGRMANGYDNSINIGGISDNAPDDTNGPNVSVFLNDESFVYGGLVNENPLLLIQLKDENGINTVGRGIGHDLTALLNDDQQNMLVLNNYYESTLDNFREGTASYPLENLPEGRHTIRIKAWDILNNSGEGYTEFVVAESEEFALSHVLNYPNPFTENTNFWFEHNRTGDALDVRVQIFTISGKLVKTLTSQIPSANTRVTELNWNGLDDYGNKLARGTYVYQLSVKSSDGKTARKIEKLVILR